MKKLFTKAFALTLMGIFATTMVFAQGAGGHDYSNVSGSPKGGEWHTFHLPKIDAEGNAISGKFENIDYYHGGHFDNISVEKFYGHHWKGHTISELAANEPIYLCNALTGEYLQIGDYWGESAMTNHAGIEYRLEATTPKRKTDNWDNFRNDGQAYWIRPDLSGAFTAGDERTIGRMNIYDGPNGHFEFNRYFALRHRSEYDEGQGGHPGGFAFQFKKVDLGDGNTYYVIYTHRQTSSNGRESKTEYRDRESYLLIRSAGKLNVDGQQAAGYNRVRFKKFAGQMRGSFPGIKMTFHRTSTTEADVYITDMNGNPIPGASAQLVGLEFTGNDNPQMKTGTASALTDGIVLAPNQYSNGNGDELRYTFKVEGLGSSYSFNAADIDVYNMDSNGNPQNRNGTGNFLFYVKTGNSESDLTTLVSKTENTNIISEDVTPTRTGGLDHGNIVLSGGSSVTTNGDFYIQVILKKNQDKGCYAGIGGLKLYDRSSAGDHTIYWGDDRDNAIYDETDFTENYLTLQQGVDKILALPTDECKEHLWKIVTKTERERYRLVASEDKPIDMTYRLKNPKFYTAYTYSFHRTDLPDNGGTETGLSVNKTTGVWKHTNGGTPMGWQWFDGDRIVGEELEDHHHVHVRGLGPGNYGYYDPESDKREFHKIGTGLFYRYHVGDAGYASAGDKNEFMITKGQEANYVGSIWKGTADLIQTIGTGTAEDPKLREGLYLVCVKGFFAPHDMMKYEVDETVEGNDKLKVKMDGSTPTSTTTALSTTDAWYKEAKVVDGDDAGKWRRSHDSYLFAYSYPDGNRTRLATQADVDAGAATSLGDVIDNSVEVRRMLPSIYEGAIRPAHLYEISKEDYINNSTEFYYTQLGQSRPAGGWEAGSEPIEVKYMLDNTNFAKYNGAFFGGNSNNFAVPKTLIAAGRWFNAIDGIISGETTYSNTYTNAANYRIALPVYVGNDGLLTIGVDHTRLAENVVYEDKNGVEHTIVKSGEDEWICFDDFELIYLGKVEPDEFVIDEQHGRTEIGGPEDENFYTYNGNTGELVLDGNNEPIPLNTAAVTNKNNTQWIDLFNPSDIATSPDATTVKNVIIRRTMTKDGWNSIVFPMALTGPQIKAGFGENAKVAYLTGVTDHRGSNNTIEYTLVNLDEPQVNDVDPPVIVAGQPYVIKPSIDPVVRAGDKLTRTKFTLAYSTSASGVANWFLKTPERNKEVERQLEGPIYIIEDVTIKAVETFPDVVYSNVGGQHSYSGDGSIWTKIGNDNEESHWKNGFGQHTVGTYSIQYKPASEKYNLVETAHYYGGGEIPAYSYFHTNGQIYYTKKNLTTSKGLYAYLQLIHEDDGSAEAGKAYTKPFIGGEDIFIPVIENEIDGIEDVNVVPDLDNGTMQIYDLMGRKVTNPRRGSIYIMNGVKVLFK